MTLYNYNINLETCLDLYDSKGMRYLHEELDNGITISPVIKINKKFFEGNSFSVECDGRKKSKGYKAIYFKKNIWNFWFKGYNDYDYLMVELNDYTFHRWGEMPFLVLKGYVGIEANGKKYVDIKECFIYDLIFYNNNKNNNPYSYYCDKNNLVHYFDQYGEVYYDYTYIFDTTIKNKL